MTRWFEFPLRDDAGRDRGFIQVLASTEDEARERADEQLADVGLSNGARPSLRRAWRKLIESQGRLGATEAEQESARRAPRAERR